MTTEEYNNKLRILIVLLPKLFKNLLSQLSIKYKEDSLNTNQSMTLLCLTDHNPATMGELYNHSRLTKGALTQIIDNLEQKDLIQRSRNDKDRRTVYVSLKDEGLKLGKEIEKGLLTQLSIGLAKLDKAEQQKLETSLNSVTEILEKMEKE